MLLLVLSLVACPRGGPGSRGPEVVDVAVSGSTACALSSTGSVRCWGERLGTGGGDTGIRPLPLLEVRTLGAGPHNLCAATVQSLHCWGDWSASGAGPGDDKAAPGWALPLMDVQVVSLGERHGCALSSDGAVHCWGRSPLGAEFGVLGTGALESAAPVAVSLRGRATDLEAGFAHTCALREDGAVLCWGDNACGQLGDDSDRDAGTPVLAATAPGARALAAGASSTCLVDGSGAVQCWGCVDDLGVVGAGTEIIGRSRTPRPVARVPSPTVPGLRFDDLHASHGGSLCGLAENGQVLCWGDNDLGQLGQGEGPDRKTPVVVAVDGARLLGAGEEAVCAVDHAGAVLCWGHNRDGVLGADAPGRISPPRVVLAPPR